MQVTRPMLNYFGGKWNISDWVISHFPEHKVYVEVFGGGLSVFMRKGPVKVEVINDIENRIVNVYKQIRDNSDKLSFLLQMTPYSRKEFRDCQIESNDLIEDARRTICALAMGVGHSLADSSSGLRNSKKSSAQPSKSFRVYAENFMQFHQRIKNALIENVDFKSCIEKYDDDETLFYLDPPYVHESRTSKSNYTHEMSNEDHIELIRIIQNLKGKCVLSGYENSIYKDLPWQKFKTETLSQNASKKTEVLWVCPKTSKEQKQMEFS